MTEAQKDTIYVDVDDEITGIIDKVKTSKHKIVALVLPKRATVLQSVVNMKLLKRSADSSKKKLVLITSEAGLMPLAGAVGLHVAKNLQSKPAIPTGPDSSALPESLVHEEEIETGEPEVDTKKSVGELAGIEDNSMPPEDEAIDVDNTATPAEKPGKTPKKAAVGKNKNLKVPNFERFRKWFIIGGIALVVLLVGGYFAFFQLPKATITIDAASTDKVVNVTFTADTAATAQLNETTNLVPSQKQEVKKTDTQTAPATGQKNNGNKASGEVTMNACVQGITPPASVPAGTGISANGQTYITQSNATFSFDQVGSGCVRFKTGSIDIVAQNPGVAANTGNVSFAVSGRSDVTAQGKASDGTDNIVKVVSQSDVDAARGKMNASNNEQAARAEITKALEDAEFSPIPETFTANGPNYTTSPNVGDQADNVTVTANTTYAMVGVNQGDLAKLVTATTNKEIDTNTQSVINDGLDDATYTVLENGASPKVSVKTTVAVGPNLNIEELKKEIAGKKKGETIKIIQERPGIKDVNVAYSPFWVFSTPKNTNKTTIIFNKAAPNQ